MLSPLNMVIPVKFGYKFKVYNWLVQIKKCHNMAQLKYQRSQHNLCANLLLHIKFI